MFFIFGKKKYDSISTDELVANRGKINLIDVRERSEYKTGHVPNAKNIPLGELLKDPEKYLKKEREYHMMCRSGSRSTRACKKLSALGYQVVNVNGGLMSYDLPLKK
jgi:rhodanese-related sulfurtransferase